MSTRLFLVTCLLGLSACDGMPGKPKASEKWTPASEVTDFTTLYAQNCLACHSNGETIAASLAMDTPAYLAVVPREVLENVIANGVPGTAMPAFLDTAGGALTAAQITILADGIFAKKPPVSTSALPPYASPPGDVARGAEVFSVACAACHGADGAGLAGKAGSVVNAPYLNLVSNQYLRTIVISGRPELGCPDFAHRIAGQEMTNEQIADVTAWLISHRRDEFGQPITPTPLP